jgi:hypothetical protein
MNVWSIIDYVLVGLGIYALYSVFQMKVTGELYGKMFFSVHTPIERCKDKAGFIEFIIPKLIIIGILAISTGGISLVSTYVVQIPSMIVSGVGLVLVGVLLWFNRQMKAVQKKYW